jgi:hypothetical protein
MKRLPILLMAVSFLSSCQYVTYTKGTDDFSFNFRNDSKQRLTEVGLWKWKTLSSFEYVDPGRELGEQGAVGSDPTWYIFLQFTTPDGKIHRKGFFRLVPWGIWRDCARGEREITFVIHDPQSISVEISENMMEEAEKKVREHPELFPGSKIPNQK